MHIANTITITITNTDVIIDDKPITVAIAPTITINQCDELDGLNEVTITIYADEVSNETDSSNTSVIIDER